MSIEISDNEVHVWRAFDRSYDQKDFKYRYYQLLNSAEHTRYQSFKFDEDRHQFLVTRVMLKKVLSQYVSQIKPSQWCFDYNKYGKPKISSNLLEQAVHFNISHTRGCILLAISIRCSVGVDVESLYIDDKVLDIAPDVFNTEELDYLKKSNYKSYKARFMQLWTLKESFIKAKGKGLSMPLSDFSVIPNNDSCGNATLHTYNEDSTDIYSLRSFYLRNDLVAAIAVRTNTSKKFFLEHMLADELVND